MQVLIWLSLVISWICLPSNLWFDARQCDLLCWVLHISVFLQILLSFMMPLIYWKPFYSFDVCFYDLLSRSEAGLIILPTEGRPCVLFLMPCELCKFFQCVCWKQALRRHHTVNFHPASGSFLIYIISTLLNIQGKSSADFQNFLCVALFSPVPCPVDWLPWASHTLSSIQHARLFLGLSLCCTQETLSGIILGKS